MALAVGGRSVRAASDDRRARRQALTLGPLVVPAGLMLSPPALAALVLLGPVA